MAERRRPGLSYGKVLHHALACAWCTHLTTREQPRCDLDHARVSLENGTCGAWRLDQDIVIELSAHEKAEALVLKHTTYHEDRMLQEVADWGHCVVCNNLTHWVVVLKEMSIRLCKQPCSTSVIEALCANRSELEEDPST